MELTFCVHQFNSSKISQRKKLALSESIRNLRRFFSLPKLRTRQKLERVFGCFFLAISDIFYEIEWNVERKCSTIGSKKKSKRKARKKRQQANTKKAEDGEKWGSRNERTFFFQENDIEEKKEQKLTSGGRMVKSGRIFFAPLKSRQSTSANALKQVRSTHAVDLKMKMHILHNFYSHPRRHLQVPTVPIYSRLNLHVCSAWDRMMFEL